MKNFLCSSKRNSGWIAVFLLLALMGNLHQVEALSIPAAGQTFFFGTYQGEPIEWLVLDNQSSKAFVLSVKALEAVPFSKSDRSHYWADSYLREWMNGTFYENSFTEEEKALIMQTNVINSRTSQWRRATGENQWDPDDVPQNDPGPDTTDRFFALSIDEYYIYESLGLNEAPELTASAVKNGAWVYRLPNESRAFGDWWLRSPGSYYEESSCMHVAGGGGYMLFTAPSSQSTCARPAMYIQAYR